MAGHELMNDLFAQAVLLASGAIPDEVRTPPRFGGDLNTPEEDQTQRESQVATPPTPPFPPHQLLVGAVHPPSPGFADGSSFDDEVSFDSTCSRSMEELESFKKKMIDDERLSQIFKMRYNFSERFDNRAYIHPHGMTNFDYKAIPEPRKPGFEKFKNKVREENYAYLAQHPEIGAMVSLLVKKILQVRPSDPAHYLAEYFTSRVNTSSDFKDVLDHEMQRISRYRVNKMKAAGKINIKTSNNMNSDATDLPPIAESDANFAKKLNIGPLAQDFYFDGTATPRKKSAVKEDDGKGRRKKGKKKHYCGCKDWKLKKGRRQDPEATLADVTTEEEEDDEVELEETLVLNNNGLPTAEQIAEQIMKDFIDTGEEEEVPYADE
ncbi:hypothetical protein Ocin01_12966 [Orchesella cincta]|uniref:RIIa domain-containing protein n=1 Tax=Orchesella cincta TaxID=48709 RepID=A0A1D2MLC5_ORCCI|nr:hypothetical protein Ocin01_12966 [Orchesella cincta]